MRFFPRGTGIFRIRPPHPRRVDPGVAQFADEDGDVVVTPTPAGSIAGIVAPIVILGSLVITPPPADSIASTIDPTVIGGGSELVIPAPADSIASSIDPTVILGSLVLTTAPADSLAGTVDPTVIKGSLLLSPVAIGSIAETVDPTVLGGADELVVPTPAETIATTIDPTVIGGADELIVPAPIGTIATTVDPTVLLGSLVLTPAAIGTIAEAIDPTVIEGSLTLTATPADTIAEVVDPTVLGGADELITPSPATTIATVVDPTVLGGADELIVPAPADTIATTVDPTVIGGGSELVTPAAIGTIADTVDPAVLLGSVTVTTTPAGTIADTVDPTVIAGGDVVVIPAAVGTIATVVNPTVVGGGSELIAPTPAETIAETIDPTVIEGSLVLTPTPAETIAAVVDPTVLKGSLSLTPPAVGTIAETVDPTVVGGGSEVVTTTPAGTLAGVVNPTVIGGADELITPTPAETIAETVDPTVIGGADELIAPTAAETIAETVDPTVVEGSLTLTPVAVGTIAETVDPTVTISGADVVVTPAAVGTIATTVNPTVVGGGSEVIAPTAAETIADAVDPTVLTGPVVVSPAPADTIAEVVDPTVIGGADEVATPAPAETIASTVDPTVIGGADELIAPSPAETIAATVDPAVVLGSITITPTPVGTIATTVDPTVLADELVTPSPAETIATVVNPTVIGGGAEVVAPSPAETIATVVDPTVVLGSLTLAPDAVGTIATVVNPTVIGGGAEVVAPAPAETIAETVDPVIIESSVAITPAPAGTIATVVDPTVLVQGEAFPDAGNVLYAAGFDSHGADTADFDRYDSFTNLTWNTATGKFGAGALKFIPSATNNLRLTVANSVQRSGYASFYWKRGLDAGVNSEFFILMSDGGTFVHFYIEVGNSDRKSGVDDDSKIILLNEGDTLLGQSINTFFGNDSTNPGPWYHADLYWKLGQGDGEFKLWVDGFLEIDVSGVTLGSTGDLDDWRLWRVDGPQGFLSANDFFRIDDMVIQSGGGFRLLDGHRIWNGLPDSDISSQFTPSAGGDNFALVDDTDPDMDTTYVESTGAGQRDVYGAAAPSVGGDTILAVTVKALTRRASGSGDLKLGAQVGSDVLLSAAISPDATLWKEQSATMVERPAGGAWTQADLDNLEPVIEATASGVRVTMVWIEVLTITFTFPGQPVLSIGDVRDITAVLTTGTFVPGESGAHQATQWQVTLSTDGGFASPVYDSGPSLSLLLATTATGLTADTVYIARVRQQEDNDAWSPWSQVEAFTTDGPPEKPTVTFGSAEGDHIVWDGSTYVPGTGSTPHAQTQWQVTLHTDTGFASPVIDYTTAAPSELEQFVAFGITPFLLQYIARARYQDANGIWSPWSDASSASPLVGTGQFYTAFAERPLGTDPSIDPVADWEEIITADGSSTWVLTERSDATCRVVSRREQVLGDGNSIDPVFWQGFPSVGEQIVFSRIIFDLTGTGGHTCVGDDGSPDGLICRISIGKLHEENFDNLDAWRVVRSGNGEWKLAPDRGSLRGDGAEHAGEQALLYRTNQKPPHNPFAYIVWDGAGDQAVGSWVQARARKTNFDNFWWFSPVPGLAFAQDANNEGYATVNVHQCGLFATWVFQTHYLFTNVGVSALEMFLNVFRIVGGTLSFNTHMESYEYVKASFVEDGYQQSYLAKSTQYGQEVRGRQSFDFTYNRPGKVGLMVIACPEEFDDHDGDCDILFDNVVICSANTVEVQGLPDGWRLDAEIPTIFHSVWPRVTGEAGEPNVEMDFLGNAWPADTLTLYDAEGQFVTSWDVPGGIWGGDVYLINAGGIGVGKLGGPAARLSSIEPIGFLLLESGDRLLLESSGSLILQ